MVLLLLSWLFPKQLVITLEVQGSFHITSPRRPDTATPLWQDARQLLWGQMNGEARNPSDHLPPASSIIADSSRSLLILIKPSHQYCWPGYSPVSCSLSLCLCRDVYHKSNPSVDNELGVVHRRYE